MIRHRLLSALRQKLVRLLRAAPVAWRHDPIFRYAATGAAVALVVLLARLGGNDPDRSPGPSRATVPAPAALGDSYRAAGEIPSPITASAAPPAPVPTIAPGRTLDGVRIEPAPADRFGIAPSER